jgi:hypothetical protein
MPRYSHVPFSVYRQSFGGIGDAGLKRYDVMQGDSSQSGLGVPAKSIAIVNHGAGILYYQISSNGIDISVVDGIDSGQAKIFSPDEGIYTQIITLYSDNAATVFSFIATPGIWTDEELADLFGG